MEKDIKTRYIAKFEIDSTRNFFGFREIIILKILGTRACDVKLIFRLVYTKRNLTKIFVMVAVFVKVSNEKR